MDKCCATAIDNGLVTVCLHELDHDGLHSDGVIEWSNTTGYSHSFPDKEIERLRRLQNRTPYGRWAPRGTYIYRSGDPRESRQMARIPFPWEDRLVPHPVADFIASSHNALPAILAEIATRRIQLKTITQLLLTLKSVLPQCGQLDNKNKCKNIATHSRVSKFNNDDATLYFCMNHQKLFTDVQSLPWTDSIQSLESVIQDFNMSLDKSIK